MIHDLPFNKLLCNRTHFLHQVKGIQDSGEYKKVLLDKG